MNDARAKYLEMTPESELSSTGYEATMQAAIASIPVYRELSLDEYLAEADGYDNSTMPLDKKSEVIMLRLDDGTIEYRTFGIYDGE
jgi:hypothetical protein